MTGEDLFVEKVRAAASGSARLKVGIGDDAAVVEVAAGLLAATTDLLVEGVDFLPGESPEAIGRRAFAVNVSDLAAMGARPEFFLLSVGFPRRLGADYALAVVRGALSRATPLEAVLAGGDLSDAPQTVVSIALWGRPEGTPLTRSGARPGDAVFLSGWPGRAAAGLRLARMTAAFASQGAPPTPHLIGLAPGLEAELTAAYRDPEPRLEVGCALARERLATAAIDVSDGVGIDAARLARASGVRIVLEGEKLPVAVALAAYCDVESLDPTDLILSGGDDYELLFTAPDGAGAALDALAARTGVALRRVGACHEGSGAAIAERAGERDVSGLGFDHLDAPS
jgi:thiamine-monophosphate kinase